MEGARSGASLSHIGSITDHNIARSGRISIARFWDTERRVANLRVGSYSGQPARRFMKRAGAIGATELSNYRRDASDTSSEVGKQDNENQDNGRTL